MLLEIISKANAGKAYEQAEKFRAGRQAIVNRCREFAKNHEVVLTTGGIMGYVTGVTETAMHVSPTAAPIIVGLGIGLPVLAGATAATVDAIRNNADAIRDKFSARKVVDAIRNKFSARKASER